tara:strand:+ start:227 stop:373 length:147 start_codon:yes stop_codon:yes gene_type:complete
MSAPPDPTIDDDDGDEKCRCCGKPLKKHSPREMRECENFNEYMEHKNE